MPLSAERKAEIRQRIQSQFGVPDVRRTADASTSSLRPPNYNPKDFMPDRRSIDHRDPEGIPADSVPELKLSSDSEAEMNSSQEAQEKEPTVEATPIDSEKPDDGHVSVDPERFREAVALLKQGISNSEVSEKTGLHHSTVRKIVRDEIWAKNKKPAKPAPVNGNGRKPKASKSQDGFCLIEERRATQKKLNEEILAVQKKYDEIFRAIETVEKLMAEMAAK